MTVMDNRPQATDRQSLLQEARFRQMRMETDRLALHRTLVQLESAGAKQTEVAEALLTSQPSVSSMLRTAKKTPPRLEGFSAATPFEACELFAAQSLPRDQLIEELSTWPYPQQNEFDADDFNAPQGGTFEDVELAAMRGLIDPAIYAAVFERLTADQA